jgi:hypothetical protein
MPPGDKTSISTTAEKPIFGDHEKYPTQTLITRYCYRFPGCSTTSSKTDSSLVM